MSYLLYFSGSLKTRHRGIPTKLTRYLDPPKEPWKQPEKPGPDELVWWQNQNRTYNNKKWCFFLKKSGSGVLVLYGHKSTLPITWHNKHYFMMTQNTPSFQILWSPDCIGPGSAWVAPDISYYQHGSPEGHPFCILDQAKYDCWFFSLA